MKRSVVVLIALALVGWVTGTHAAINVGDSLTVSGNIAPGQETGYVSYGGGAPINCYAGVISVSVVDNTQGGPAFNLQSFCTDVAVDWQTGPQQYKAQTFAGATGVYPVWSYAPSSIQNAAWIYNQYFVGQSGLTALQTAGLQLAIWKVLYDTTSTGIASENFNSGLLRASGFAGLAYASSLIAALDAARANGSFIAYPDTWLSPILGNTQGLLAPDPPTAVPEPTAAFAALSLLALPVGASVARILRKRRQS